MIVPIEVRFTDVDSDNHVNHLAIAEWVAHARVKMIDENIKQAGVNFLSDINYVLVKISIDEKESSVNITATLTSAFCPFADQITNSIQKAGYTKDGNVLSVNVDITFDPPFTMASVPQDTRDVMGW